MCAELHSGLGSRASRSPLTYAFLDSPRPIAFAHRGGSVEGENGLSAFREVQRLGYRYVETDVRTTRDGVPLVFHDPDLERMTGHRGRVRDLTLAEVKRLALPSAEKIPTLAEVLAGVPDLRFNIDLKDAASVEPVPRVLRDADALDRVCVTSFSESRAAAAHRLLGPEVCTGLGVWGVVRFALTGRTRGAAVLQLPLRWRGLRVVSRRLVERAHANGLMLQVWTLNNEVSILEALDLGVDGVISDRPQLLKRLLEERELWRQSGS